MSNRPWPSSDASFNAWYKNLMQIVATYTSGTATVWGFIPKTEADGFVERYQNWYNAYAATLVPHIPSVTTKKNNQRAFSEKDIRRFIRLYLNNEEFVTDEQRRDMELPLFDRISTPVGAATVVPEGDMFFPSAGMVRVANIRPILDAGQIYDKRSLYGVKIAYGFMGSTHDKFPLQQVPKNGNDLPHSEFTRTKSYTFDFQAERGSTVYFCMRYENAKGQAGPWGPILTTLIP